MDEVVGLAEEDRMLPEPYEILDLPDGGKVDLDPSYWERGSMIIHPRYPGAPREKRIPVMRIHMREGAKAYPPMYYDVTAKTLMAQLNPMFMQRDYQDYTYRVTKHGIAPRARFTVERIPK